MTKTDMRRAAKHLRDDARMLKRSHATPCGRWPVDPDYPGLIEELRAEYDDKIELARQLDAHARTLPHSRMTIAG